MHAYSDPLPACFVKVEVRSRSPKLWGWAMYRVDGEAQVARSERLFHFAEDAWKAGRIAAGGTEPARRPQPVGG